MLSLLVSIYICFGLNLFLMIMSMIVLVVSVFSFLLVKNMAVLSIFLVILYLGGLMVLFSYATVLSSVVVAGEGDMSNTFLSYFCLGITGIISVVLFPDFIFWIIQCSSSFSGNFVSEEGGLGLLCMFSSSLLIVAGVLIISVLVFCVSLLSM